MHMSANMQEMIMEIVTRYGFQVLGALAILVAGLLVARWIGGAADREIRNGASQERSHRGTDRGPMRKLWPADGRA